MRRQIWHQFIKQAFVIDLVVCVIAFPLSRFSAWFAWIFTAALIGLIWIVVATLFSMLEFFIYADEL